MPLWYSFSVFWQQPALLLHTSGWNPPDKSCTSALSILISSQDRNKSPEMDYTFWPTCTSRKTINLARGRKGLPLRCGSREAGGRNHSAVLDSWRKWGRRAGPEDWCSLSPSTSLADHVSAETSSYLSGKRTWGLVHCAEKGPKSRGLGGGSHHTQLKESMTTSSQSPGGCLHLQHVHLREPPEGTVCQLADVVSLKLQHLQAIKALEREALNQPNPIPIQVPMEMKPSGQNIPCAI